MIKRLFGVSQHKSFPLLRGVNQAINKPRLDEDLIFKKLFETLPKLTENEKKW